MGSRNLFGSFVIVSLLSLTNRIEAQTTTVVTDPVGFIHLNVAGTNSVGSPANTFIGLSMTQPVEYQGTVTDVGISTISDTNAVWSDNQFTNGVYFLELIDGTTAGISEDILGTAASTKTLTLGSDLTGLVSTGQHYKIRRNWTIGSVFGPNNEAGLGGGNTLSAADELIVFDPRQQRPDIYFYKTGGIGGIGWRSSTNVSLNVSNTVLYVDQGIQIKRKQPSDTNMVLSGSVKLGTTIVAVSSNFNFVANVYASSLILSNSNLRTGNDATGIAGGGNASAADNVMIWNGRSWDTYYYKSSGIGGTGWRSSTNTTVDAGGTQIPLGQCIKLQRKAPRNGFNWTVPQPF